MKNISKLIEKVTPEMLENMLQYLGYHRYEFQGMDAHFVQYMTPDNEESVIVPLLPDDVDYKRNLNDLLIQVSEYSKTTIDHFILKIVNPSYDILKWRLSDDETDTGKMSLLGMSENIEGIKKILTASCLDVINPNQNYHKKTKIKKVNEALSQYKFGQTEYGSFMINILCPLGDYNYAMFDMDEIPFLRKVNLHLLDAYYNIQKSILENERNKFDEDVDAGTYSVNFLDAMTEVYNFSWDKRLSFKIEWSESVPFNDDRKDREICVNAECSGVVAEIANKYRPKENEEIDKTLVGKIESLGSEADVADRMTINIKAVVLGDDNKPFRVNAELDYANFSQIVQVAFEEGRNVRLNGSLIKVGTRNILRGASVSIIE